jgi:broad specificity phosphatase PhoE
VTRTVYLLRHGERADDVNPRWAETAPRRHDPPVTAVGVDQARRTGRFLADAGIDDVFASPFLRAVHTATHLVSRLEDVSVRIEPGLSEHLNPAWFDRRPTVLSPARLADRFDPVRPDHAPLVDPTFPESWADCRDRVGSTVRRLLDVTAGTLLLVGHGATVTGGIEAVTGRVVEGAAPYCGLSRLHRDVAGWELTYAGRRA